MTTSHCRLPAHIYGFVHQKLLWYTSW